MATSGTPVLRLDSESLLSKGGFGDGDTPEWLLDYCEDHGIEYPERWRIVLYRLVRDRLVPVLDQRVEITYIDTIHNPVRAVTVDGEDVTDQWYEAATTRLTPEFVDVPVAVVMEAVEAERARTDASP